MSKDLQAPIRLFVYTKRKTLGLTQAQMAEVLGMSRLSYHRMEMGERIVKFDDIGKLCDLFDCTVESMVGEDLASFYRRIKSKIDEAISAEYRRGFKEGEVYGKIPF